MLEWVGYHRLLGFDEIVVYDNASRDGTAALCKALETLGLIRYRFWPDPPAGSGTGPQVPAYEHAAANTLADWVGFLDLDEFLVLTRHDTVQAFITEAGRQGMPIALNWKIFGSSGHATLQDGLVIETYTGCGGPELDVNRHIKTLGPTAVLRNGARVHIHGWVLAPGQFYVDASGAQVEITGHTFLAPPRWEQAWVNHYIVKSGEDFEAKRRRGKATHAVDDPTKYDRTIEGYFKQYDQNGVTDTAIWPRRAALHRLLQDWRSRLPRVG